MDVISADLKDRLSDRLRSSPVATLLHATIEEVSLDSCVLKMPYRREVSNGYGAVHGGVLATLADTAMAFALSTNFDGEMPFATADLTIHYFKRATTEVTARARVVKKGKRINVGIIDLYDTGGELLATVLTSFLLNALGAGAADEGEA
jgi:uncharacterized protein (TIGR00369 family)